MSYDHTLSGVKAELWQLGEERYKKIPGTPRNRPKNIEVEMKTAGTYYWALNEAQKVASPAWDEFMTDNYCQKLIDIINQGI